MRSFFLFLLVLISAYGNAQVRLKLYYSRDWFLVPPDSAAYVRMCIYDTTNLSFAGPVTDMYLNGKPQMTGTYKFQKKDGLFNFYYNNGALESTGNFENNERAGLWKFFYRNGLPRMEVQFTPGFSAEPIIHSFNDSTGNSLLKDGTGKWIEISYYGKGQKNTVTGEYKNYQRNGKWRIETIRGIREEEFVDGRFVRGVVQTTDGSFLPVFEPIQYSIYIPDKFKFTEQFVASNVDFKTFPALKGMRIGTVWLTNLPESDSDEAFVVVDQPASYRNDPTPVRPGLKEPLFMILEGLIDEKFRHSAVVQVGFIVNKNGSLSDFQIVNGVDRKHDEEAIRVFKEYAKRNRWVPGMRSGKIVRQRVILPLTFGPSPGGNIRMYDK